MKKFRQKKRFRICYICEVNTDVVVGLQKKPPTSVRRSSVFTGVFMASFKRLKQTRVKLIYNVKHLAVVEKNPDFCWIAIIPAWTNFAS